MARGIADSWFQTRKSLTRELRRRVASITSSPPADFVSYEKSYQRSLSFPWRPCKKWDVLGAIAKSRIILLGDFHTLAVAQKNQLKILQSTRTTKRKVLALEAFETSAQPWLNRFIVGEIDERTLRAKSKWNKNWGFPWENYLPLLLWAKKNKCELLALRESGANRLREMDEYAAERILSYLLQNRDAMIFAVFGEYHIGSNHLALKLNDRMKREKLFFRTTSVHMNPESVYLDLVRSGREHKVDFVTFGPDRFAIVNSPPWVAWLSYLNFLESQIENDDLQESVEIENSLNRNYEILLRDIGLELRFPELKIVEPNNLRIESLSQKLSANSAKLMRWHIRNCDDFVDLDAQVAYCSQTSLNHLAEMSGRILHAQLCKGVGKIDPSRSNFLAQIWCEAAAFFMSKLINSRRQCATLHDMRRLLGDRENRANSALALALDQRMTELVWQSQGRHRALKTWPRSREVVRQAAKLIGPMMGERIYHAFRSKKLSRTRLQQMLSTDIFARDFQKKYYEWVFEFGPDLQLGKIKHERL